MNQPNTKESCPPGEGIVVAVIPRSLPNHRTMDEAKARCEEIFAAGKAARFIHEGGDVWKDVKEWNPDEEGDLKAFRTSDSCESFFVYPPGYKEIVPVEIELQPSKRNELTEVLFGSGPKEEPPRPDPTAMTFSVGHAPWNNDAIARQSAEVTSNE